MQKILKIIGSLVARLLLVAVIAMMIGVNPTHAAALTSISDTMSNQTKSVASDHLIAFTTTVGNTMPAGAAIVINFSSSSGTTFNASTMTLADVYLKTYATPDTACTTGGGSMQTLATSGSGDIFVVTFTATSVTLTRGAGGSSIGGNSSYCLYLGVNPSGGVSRIVNPNTSSTSATHTVSVTAGTDSAPVVVPILDQGIVTVTATVDPVITFTLDATTCNLGSLSASSVASCGIRFHMATNATNGDILSFRDNDPVNSGLRSAVGNIISNVSDGAVGGSAAEEYGIGFSFDVTSYGLTQDVPLDTNCTTSGSSAVSNPAMAITTSNQTFLNIPFAHEDPPVSMVMCFSAKITGTTPAGAYTQRVVFTSVGRF